MGDPVAYPPKNVLAKKYGQAVIDFANAGDTDEACFGFFDNLQSLFAFTPEVANQIKHAFPALGSRAGLSDGLNQKLAELLLEKKRLLFKLNERFAGMNYSIEDYDALKRTLNLVSLDWERDRRDRDALDTANSGGAGFLETFKLLGLSIVDGPITVKIDAITDEIEASMGSEALEQIRELAGIGHTIAELTNGLDEQRLDELNFLSEENRKIIKLHRKIEKVQSECRDLLDSASVGQRLNQIPALSHFLAIHNGMQTDKMVIGDDDCLLTVGPVDETTFLGVGQIGGWYDVLLKGISFCVVAFFKSRPASRLVRRCRQCRKYYLAKLSNQLYCAKACRLDWHKSNTV